MHFRVSVMKRAKILVSDIRKCVQRLKGVFVAA